MKRNQGITSYFATLSFITFVSFILLVNCFLGALLIYRIYNFGIETLFTESLIFFSAFALLIIAFFPFYKSLNSLRYISLKNDKIEVSKINMLGYGAPQSFPMKEKEYELHQLARISLGKFLNNFVEIRFSNEQKTETVKCFLKPKGLEQLQYLLNKKSG